VSALLDSLADSIAPGDELARERAGHVRALELPTLRSERWRYTPLRALAARRFRPATPADRAAIDPQALAGIPAPRLVVVNGQFDAGLSDVAGLPDGVRLEVERGMHGMSAGKPDWKPDDTFFRLNLAFATAWLTVDIAAGVTLAEPLHWVSISAPVDGDLAVHANHRIRLGDEASATLVEHHLAVGAHRHLVNQSVSVALSHGAQLRHVRIQDEDAGASLYARTEARLNRNARYHRVDIEIGAALSRHEVAVDLFGQHARFESGGVLAASQRRHLDTRMEVTHSARDTACDLVWRGAAAGRSRVAFHGGITIQAGADGSAAALSNKNLLLSEHAEIDTQPVLEIHADEVTASHGATVGRLDPMHLFYLRARGIGEAQARSMLTAAFGHQALAPLPAGPLVDLLAERLRDRLAGLDAE
jgi:Fe-S cluster assembly protein SufD